jgi:TfoX/Sxy family transcriptional regulator of competence genes
MHIPKASDEVKATFRALVPEATGVQVKAMFGNLGAFVNGNMFAGLFGEQIGVKLLDAASRAELSGVAGTGPFGPPERPMGGYIGLPGSWTRSPKKASIWIERAMLEVGALPAKKPKTAKNRPEVAPTP